MFRPFYALSNEGREKWVKEIWDVTKPLDKYFFKCHGDWYWPTFRELVSFLGMSTLLKCLLELEQQRSVSQSASESGPTNETIKNPRPSLLWWAAAGGEVAIKVMQLLLRLDEKNENPSTLGLKNSPLHVAAACGNVAGVELLLAQKFMGPDTKDDMGYTPLYNAATLGQTKVVELLVHKYGVHVNSRGPNDRTALHAAARNDHYSVTRFLLDQPGVDVNARSGTSDTALGDAAMEIFTQETVKLLLERHADPNIQNNEGKTALYRLAVATGWSHGESFTALAGYLLNAGADPNIANEKGMTPLMLAADNAGKELVGALLASKSTDPNIKDGKGQTALDHALRSTRGRLGEEGAQTIKKLLSDPRVDPESQDARGWTSLFHAVTDHSWTNEYGDILLASGRVDPNREDNCGRTPLSHAAGTGSFAAVRLLLKYGAVADKKDHKGRSPLWWAKNWTARQQRRTDDFDEYDYDFEEYDYNMSRYREAKRSLENREDVDSNPKDNDGLAPDDPSLISSK